MTPRIHDAALASEWLDMIIRLANCEYADRQGGFLREHIAGQAARIEELEKCLSDAADCHFKRRGEGMLEIMMRANRLVP